MKKLVVLLGLLPVLPALAQTQPAATLPTGVRVAQMRISSSTPPEQVADEETKILTNRLSLSFEQVVQVRAAALIKAQDRQARLRQLEASHAQGRIPKGPEDIAREEEFEQQLQAICTPAQYERQKTITARLHRFSAQADSVRQVSSQLSPR
jgi:regulator of protease activity HflC (stomatin/prohibitin superfamily)